MLIFLSAEYTWNVKSLKESNRADNEIIYNGLKKFLYKIGLYITSGNILSFVFCY